MDIYGLGGHERAREATGETHNLALVVQSCPIVWVTGRPVQMYASLVVLCKVCRSLVVLSKCLGHRSSFAIVWVTGRPLQMYGSPVVLFKCAAYRSSIPNVWVSRRPFQVYGSPVAMGGHGRPREAMGSVSFGLGTTSGTGLKGHGRPREATGGHGRPWRSL